MTLKSWLLALPILLATTLLTAQDAAPTYNWVVGGSLSGSVRVNQSAIFLLPNTGFPIGSPTTFVADATSSTVQISPYIAKVMNPNWLLGGLISISSQTLKRDNINGADLKNSFTGLGLGVFGRYVFNPTTPFQLYLQPSAAFSVLSGKSRVNNDVLEEDNFSSLSFLVGAGALYEITPRWRATLSVGGIGYQIDDLNPENAGDKPTHTFTTELNLSSIQLGVEMKF